jgi:hypothetical protein
MTTSKWLLSLVVAMMIGAGSAPLLRAEDKPAPTDGTTATAGSEGKDTEKPKAPKKEDDGKPEAPKAPKAPEKN